MFAQRPLNSRSGTAVGSAVGGEVSGLFSRSATVGDVLCAVRVKDVAIEAMPVPVFTSGELIEGGGAEFCVGVHGLPFV